MKRYVKLKNGVIIDTKKWKLDELTQVIFIKDVVAESDDIADLAVDRVVITDDDKEVDEMLDRTFKRDAQTLVVENKEFDNIEKPIDNIKSIKLLVSKMDRVGRVENIDDAMTVLIGLCKGIWVLNYNGDKVFIEPHTVGFADQTMQYFHYTTKSPVVSVNGYKKEWALYKWEFEK